MRAVLQPEESRVTCHVSRGRGPWYRGVLGTEVSISGETPTSQEAARSRSQAPSQCVPACGNTPLAVTRRLEKVEGSRNATFVSV